MLVDGKKIAADIEREIETRVRLLLHPPTLAVVMAGTNPSSVKYVERKRALGERVGIPVIIHTLSSVANEDEVLRLVETLSRDVNISGIIVQLPLPHGVDSDRVLNAVPPEKDVDALGKNAFVEPPVVAAIREILKRHSVEVTGKRAVVIGKGKLVGKPVSDFLRRDGARVRVADSETADLKELTNDADIIVTGAGAPGLVKEHMVKYGVVIVDAATSEANGKLQGDVVQSVANKALLMTPVPGGVGPITVVMLFRNLLDLARMVSK